MFCSWAYKRAESFIAFFFSPLIVLLLRGCCCACFEVLSIFDIMSWIYVCFCLEDAVVDDVVGCCWFSCSGGSFNLGESGLFDAIGRNVTFLWMQWWQSRQQVGHSTCNSNCCHNRRRTSWLHFLGMTKKCHLECPITAFSLSRTASSLHNL